MPEPSKLCLKCALVKPASAFSRNRTTGDGLQGWCKVCSHHAHHEWVRANRKQREANDRLHIERYPQKARARRQLKYAVRVGLVVKPERCEGCNEPFSKRSLHGHHPDYQKPLEVEWLCRGCHNERHREEEASHV